MVWFIEGARRKGLRSGVGERLRSSGDRGGGVPSRDWFEEEEDVLA